MEFVLCEFMSSQNLQSNYLQNEKSRLVDCFVCGVNYTRPWPWRRSWEMKTFSGIKALIRQVINILTTRWRIVSLTAPSSENSSAEPFLGLDKSNPSAFIDDLGCDLLMVVWYVLWQNLYLVEPNEFQMNRNEWIWINSIIHGFINGFCGYPKESFLSSKLGRLLPWNQY